MTPAIKDGHETPILLNLVGLIIIPKDPKVCPEGVLDYTHSLPVRSGGVGRFIGYLEDGIPVDVSS